MASNGPPYDNDRYFGGQYRAANMTRPLQVNANPTALSHPGHRSLAFNDGRYNITNPNTLNTASGLGVFANLGYTTGNPYINHGTSNNLGGLNDVLFPPYQYGGHGPYPAPAPSTGFNYPHDYIFSVSNVNAPYYLNDSGSMSYRPDATYQSMSSGPTGLTGPVGFGSWTTNTQPNSNLINAHPDQPSYPMYPKHVRSPSRSSGVNVATGSGSSFSSDNTTARNVNSAPNRRCRPIQPSTSNGYGRSNGLKRSIDSDHDQPATSGRARRLDDHVGLSDHTRYRNIAQLPGRDAHPHGPSSTDFESRSVGPGMPSSHHNNPGPSIHFSNRRTASLPVRTAHVDVRALDDLDSTAVATRNNPVELDLALDSPQLLPSDVDLSGPSGLADINAVDDDPSSNVDIGGHAVGDARPVQEAALDLPLEEAWFDTWYHAERKYLLNDKPGGSTSDPVCPDANAPDSVLGVDNAKLDKGIEVDGPDTDHDSRMELSLSGLPQYLIELDALGRSDSIPGNQVLYNTDRALANNNVSASSRQSSAPPYLTSPSSGGRQVPTLVHIASDTPSIAATGSSSDQVADLADNLRGLVNYYRIRSNISTNAHLLDDNETHPDNIFTRAHPSPVAWGAHHDNSPNTGELTPYHPAYSYRHLPLGTCPTTTPLVTPTLLQPTPNRHPALRQLNLHLASSVERGGQANLDGGFGCSALYQHDPNNVGQRQSDSFARPLGVRENPRTLESSRSPKFSHSEPTRSVGHADSAQRPPMPQPPAQVGDTPIRTKRIYMVRSGEGEHM